MRRSSLLTRFDEIFLLVAPATDLALKDTLAPRLRSLFAKLSGLHSLTAAPSSPAQVRDALVELIAFLVSEPGRQPLHWRVTRECLLTENEWEMDWSNLPDALEDLFFSLVVALAGSDRLGASPEGADSLAELGLQARQISF